MDALECITSRRSIRSFTPEPVSREELEKLVRYATHSPSAGNGQSWKFVIVTDRRILDAIPGIQTYAGFVNGAPAGILVCGDSSVNADMWVQDASIAAYAILLAAHAEGLGGCWLAVEPFKEFIDGFRRLLKLPDNIHPLCFIALGHPAEEHAPVDRFDPDKVHYDIW